MKRLWVYLTLALCAGLLNGCSTGAYFWQATAGHLKILAAAQDINELIDKPDTPDTLKKQLRHITQIRAFSVSTLALPDNTSYTRYTQLDRPFVVWNVVASPVDSLDLKTWCFPVTGCISYKGFYQEVDAVKLAVSLRREGLDVAVLGVPAYSTLGFTPDPVLSSFVNYPAGELARLVFHELAHQVVYIADDTTFNESFATAVEELGLEEWLAQPGQETLRVLYGEFDGRRRAFRALLSRAQTDLKQIYANEGKVAQSVVLEAKSMRMSQLRADYLALKAEWGGWSGYDRFMSEDLNNAKLAVSGLYNQHVPGFKGLFEWCGRDFPRFYGAVESLGQRSKEERDQVLNTLVHAPQKRPVSACSEGGFDAILQHGPPVLKDHK
ncbi:putative aminopeptidase [Limnobacter thiooxidans]|uniref:aminopeptidase n=1 Tax=Limnobacter thiooxidans TaxID=131080 RepID=UPI00102DFBAA|nr:putative aminopeptidase [Limnobacter thiooxidans]